MRSKDYLHPAEHDRVTQLQTFARGLPGLAATFELDAAVVAGAGPDAAMYAWMVARARAASAFAQACTAYKQSLAAGKDGAESAPPVLADPGPPPAPVRAGILRRFRALARRIKAHPAFQPQHGDTLGINAPEQEFRPEEGRPRLRPALVGVGVALRWGKGRYQGVRVEGAVPGGWEVLGFSTRSPFLDTRPGPAPGTSELRTYRAIYLLADAPVGRWSDSVEVAVPGR